MRYEVISSATGLLASQRWRAEKRKQLHERTNNEEPEGNGAAGKQNLMEAMKFNGKFTYNGKVAINVRIPDQES